MTKFIENLAVEIVVYIIILPILLLITDSRSPWTRAHYGSILLITASVRTRAFTSTRRIVILTNEALRFDGAAETTA